MRILKLRVKGLKLFDDWLEIDFTTLQRVRKEKNEMLYEVSPQIRTNNALSLIGINASGKTTTLKVISFVIQMLNNTSINNIENNDILNGLTENDEVLIETYFTSENLSVNKLNTYIKLAEKSINGNDRYAIEDEQMWRKSIKGVDKLIQFLYSHGQVLH